MTLTRLMFSSVEWSLPNTWINMNMPDVWKPFNGSVSFVLLRHQTRWGLKCSTLAMGSSTLMVLTKRSGCVAINAKRLSICAVSLRRKKKISNFPSCAGSMSVGSNPKFKRVGLAIKQVIFSYTVARQKTTKKKVRRAKDGRVIAPRKTASAGRDQKEQLWKVQDLDRAFDLWERNKGLPPKERWSKNRISKETGIPYTTICERLSGRRGGGKRGKIAGGKCTAKVLKAGKFKRVTFTNFKQVMIWAGNHLLDHLCNPPLPLFLP